MLGVLAKSGVKDASRAALEDLSHTRLVDTLHRRLGLLLDAAADLRQGVKGDNHVDLLNPARQNVRCKHLLSNKPSTGEWECVCMMKLSRLGGKF